VLSHAETRQFNGLSTARILIIAPRNDHDTKRVVWRRPRSNATMGAARLSRKTIAGLDPSAGPVVAVDPKLMVVTPGPMPRDKTPVSSTSPIARPIGVIRLIAHLDVKTNRIRCTCECAHAEQSSEKQSKFLHSCFLCIDFRRFRACVI